MPPGDHIGRSFSGSRLEDECPCPKAPCGLVISGQQDLSCLQHRVNKTIRQSHSADECPGAPQPAAKYPAGPLSLTVMLPSEEHARILFRATLGEHRRAQDQPDIQDTWDTANAVKEALARAGVDAGP